MARGKATVGVIAPTPVTIPRSDNEPDILIGTHALLHEKTPPPRLGLVVIDEQHKFGVLQRAALSKGRKLAPDVLVMTATPIPADAGDHGLRRPRRIYIR